MIEDIYVFLKSKLALFDDYVFEYDGGYLRLSEGTENIYIEFADTLYMAQNNMYEDSGCYEKSEGVENIIKNITEDFEI